MRRFLILDYETRSECDLRKSGAYEYANHPTTEIICVAWRLGTREELLTAPVHSWPGDKKLSTLVEMLITPENICVAHNALFEQLITRFTLSKKFPRLYITPQRWICTASLAAALALPRNLESACQALGLSAQKDMEGRRLMLKHSKPRRITKNNGSQWHEDPEERQRIFEYCKKDIEAETELFLKLPMLNPTERKVWLLDQKMNMRGFQIDVPLVKTVLKMIDEETTSLQKETNAITSGFVKSVSQRDTTLSWLANAKDGVYLPDLQAKTVRDALNSGAVKGDAKRILEIRQAVSKTSTAKYEAFEKRSRVDGRVRDTLLYHGASTGRWAGTGIQPQNFPRGSLKNTVTAAEILREGDLEWVRLMYGDPMSAFSSCLRSMIIASEGKELFCSDYAAIEARVLFWLADHKDGIKAFEENRPIYEEMAAFIYNVKVEDVTKVQRQLGKGAILGCGYSMSHKKFLQTCKNTGLEISEGLAKTAVQGYRKKHAAIPRLWYNYEKTAIKAVLNPTIKFSINHTRWFMKDGFLYCELPSGRKLSYPHASVKYAPPRWGEGDLRPVLYSWGMNPMTKKWEESSSYGGLLVENCFAKDTRVLTSRGWIAIANIKNTDKIFDGLEWVDHGGVICQGKKKTGKWLGVRVTENHLILAGEKWKSVQSLDEFTVLEALKLGRALTPWWLKNPVLAKILTRSVSATAVKNISLRRVHSLVKNRHVALHAAIKKRVKNVKIVITRRFLPTRNRFLVGGIVTPPWFRDVKIRFAKRTQTMVEEGLGYIRLGWPIESYFMSMQKLWKTGKTQHLKLIVSIITAIIGLEISDLSLAKSIPVIGAGLFLLLIWGKKCLTVNFTKDFALFGKAQIPFAGNSKVEKQVKRLWNATEVLEDVYDLKNCGSRHQFMIKTDRGPVIAHNCTQAIARDLMVEAMLKIEAAGYEIIMSVHDEIVAERNTGEGTLKEFEDLMAAVPEWAKGCPIKVEGWQGFRYRK